MRMETPMPLDVLLEYSEAAAFVNLSARSSGGAQEDHAVPSLAGREPLGPT